MLNYIPCHTYGGVEVVNFMHWALHSQGMRPQYPLARRLDVMAKRKIPCSCWESSLSDPALSLVTILSELI